jgi:hypothetical protein
MYSNANDLEFGPMSLTNNVKWLVKLYRSNEGPRVRYMVMSTVIITIALIIKYGFHNLDNVMDHSASVITFDEDVYIPFRLSSDISPRVDSKASIEFPIKESKVNWKIQTINLIQSRSHVVVYLDKLGYVCIHLRHFGVPYNIMVFKNITMVNPVVVGESDEMVSKKEIALDGTIVRKRRPLWLKISHRDESLTHRTVVLYGDQATCFAHYEF